MTKSRIKFFIYAIATPPLLLLIFSGVVMLKYHSGSPYSSTFLELDGNAWLTFHKVVSLITIPLIALHLFVKTNWVKNLLKFKTQRKFMKTNLIFFIVFLLCSLSALVSWLLLDGTNAAAMLRGVHNKFGLLSIVLFIVHAWNYRKLIVAQFKS